MAIWILYKPLALTDWQNEIEGYPFFYENLPMLNNVLMNYISSM